MNLSDNTPNQPPKLRTKNRVEIHGEPHGTHNRNNQISFKTMMIKSSLCDCGDAYVLVKRTI